MGKKAVHRRREIRRILRRELKKPENQQIPEPFFMVQDKRKKVIPSA